jgi:hypothetical protein
LLTAFSPTISSTREYFRFKNQDGEYSLVEFFEDMYDYNLNSLKEYMEDKEMKKKDLFPKKCEYSI